MIFAKVDVTFPRHYRLLDVRVESDRIPLGLLRAAALGVWTAALCYTREHNLDGFCPMSAIREIAPEDVLDELVRVGLFARHEQDRMHGVLVLNYAKHNETRSDVERRLQADRERKKFERRPVGRQGEQSKVSSRTRIKASERIPVGHADSVRLDSDRTLPVSAVGFPDSDSDSGSVISEGERERDPTDPAEREIQISDNLTPELRAVAELAGVQDIETAWRKFTGHYAGKWVHVAGRWQFWCANEAKRERVDRDRAATSNGAAASDAPSRKRIVPLPKPPSGAAHG